jgi:transcriptional regulator of acetoin/glycerol metabolism
MGIKDTRMMEKALKQRWPMTEEKRAIVINALLDVIQTSDKPREITAAARALMSAEAQNQTDEHKLIDAISNDHDRISQIAIDLGIDPNLIVDGSAASNSDIEDSQELE